MSEFNGRIGHLEGIESPWANAGGVAKTVDEVDYLAKTGIGWIEDGSQTLEGRLGNAYNPEHPELGPIRKVYHHDPKTGRTFNSFGMPGNSIDVWSGEIPEKVKIAEAHGKKFVQNVAPVSDSPAAESEILVRTAYFKGAHAVLLNAGCPNLRSEDGSRHKILSHDATIFRSVLLRLLPVVDDFAPIFVRISPQESRWHMEQIMETIKDSDVVSAVFVPNTWPDQHPLDDEGNDILESPGGLGGLSGPGTAIDARVQTRWAVENLKGSGIDVVSSGGIMYPQELDFRMKLGAVAGAGTTFFYEPVNGWAEDSDKLLVEFSELA